MILIPYISYNPTKHINIAVYPNLRNTNKSMYVIHKNSYARIYIEVLATTLYSIMTDLYHDTNPIYHITQQRI